MSDHTPGPWTLLPDRIAAPCFEHPNCEKTIAWLRRDGVLQCSNDGKGGAPNAEFIVRACNSHAELLAALKGLVDRALEECDTTGCCGCTDRSQEIVAARAVIAKAESR